MIVVFIEFRYLYNKKNIKLKISILYVGVFVGIDINYFSKIKYRNFKC